MTIKSDEHLRTIASAAGAGRGGYGSVAMGGWGNWAGNQTVAGITVERPGDTEDVAAVVRRAVASGSRVKAVGAGHSFSGIARPEQVMLDLSALQGLHTFDRDSGLVTVGAGTSLRRLNDLLAGVGLAMPNLGDIDAQSLAGAISTGTHGTGAKYGGLSAAVAGLEMVMADGSVLTCSPAEQPEMWSAARVGLGALGVITRVTLRCVPLFALRAEEGPMGLDELLDRFDELVASSDHFEAYWFPHTGRALTKRNARLPLAEGLDRLPGWKEWLNDEFLSNRVFGWVVELGKRKPSLIPAANGLAARALGSRSFTDLSFKVFTSPRRVRFREMELAVPRPAAAVAIREVVDAVESSGMHIAFPVELRVAAADDIPLSTASGRDSAYLAFHVPASVDHREYFRLVARVLDGYGARPHWGKIHELDAELLRTRYPRFDEFVRLRDAVDPRGLFSNGYLDRVLGPAPDSPPAG
ncbi:MAG TPA: D-arabinono-1,4-lactone oxidase [Acidimicrobiales bacterium]|nr:D-arabinono-1,4-lactone oxidase [Acidimicrobiales bacterium]